MERKSEIGLFDTTKFSECFINAVKERDKEIYNNAIDTVINTVEHHTKHISKDIITDILKLKK